MIDSNLLLSQLQSTKTSRTTVVKKLEDDLRKRCDEDPNVDVPLKARYEAARAGKRTALTYKAWREEELTNVAVAWVLACVFIRFLEDNELVETPKLSGVEARLQRARDEHELFFRQHPTGTEREYLLSVFEEAGCLPGMKEFFDKRHNPLWLAAPSGDACRELWQFWQKTDPNTGALIHDFTDPEWNTRFLGDLYQDLSEAARKRYALLQTPVFVEQFILDRTLTPAIETFGLREVRMIDPTCGSAHFLLGGFERLFRLWQEESPGENPRALAQRTLDQLFGVDLNPNVIAIARFRLLLAAVKACWIKRLQDAPDFHINVATGDTLLHGRRFREAEVESRRQALFETDDEVFCDELKHHYEVEDANALHRILGQQYHVVVGNPPYIAIADKALKAAYKQRFGSCHGKWVLAVPFMERFFDLAIKGDGNLQQPAGFVGQITSNSFMKREFGAKLIEEFIPKWDVTHVVDTALAYIPGHGTPTVIIFGRNQRPTTSKIRAVLGIRGEPKVPEDATRGLVWTAICTQITQPDSVSEWVSCANLPRAKFHSHPWSIGGGGAAELKETIDDAAEGTLYETGAFAGITAVTGEDDLFLFKDALAPKRLNLEITRPLIEGEQIRDWTVSEPRTAIWLYDEDFKLLPLRSLPNIFALFWNHRSIISKRKRFGTPMLERGLTWFEWQELYADKLKHQELLVFASVATHNHFYLSRGMRVFKQSAPVIAFPAETTENQKLAILAIMNSSLACFWIKQVCYPKATTTGDISSEKGRPEANRYDINSTAIESFPIPPLNSPAGTCLVEIGRLLNQLGKELMRTEPEFALREISASADYSTLPNKLRESESAHTAILGKLVFLQEELDWCCYWLYGLEGADPVPVPEASSLSVTAPESRPFMCLQSEESSPEFGMHKTYELRRRAIEKSGVIRLIETPVFKRLWRGRQGVYGSTTKTYRERVTNALQQWLSTRLEGYFYGGTRVCDLKGSFDAASRGFKAATRPHLVSVNQLADVAQTDECFMEVAEIYIGSTGFSISKLVRELVETASVPYLPVQRYKQSGLRKRHDWEQVWDLQRQEDKIDIDEKVDEPGIFDVERLNRNATAKKRKQAEIGEVPVPPKYASADFKKGSYWSLRGKLDVPKERWVSYPGAERAGDESLLIAWAGWDHLQQAQSLAEYYLDAKDNQGWPAEQLILLLAGLTDLIPWLKQWHNELDPNLGVGLGDYFAGFVEEQCRALDISVEQADKARFGNAIF